MSTFFLQELNVDNDDEIIKTKFKKSNLIKTKFKKILILDLQILNTRCSTNEYNVKGNVISRTPNELQLNAMPFEKCVHVQIMNAKCSTSECQMFNFWMLVLINWTL